MTCKPLKLSHSAATKYTECPRSYKYHYVDRFRANVQSSALLFGTAIDKSAEHYAVTKNFDETLALFEKTWQTQEINGKEEDLRFLLNFTYSDKDLDTDLLKSEDWELLEEKGCTTGDSHDNPEEVLKEVIYNKGIVGYSKMGDGDQLIFNYANWLCLRRKGILMLKEFKKVFDDNVEEVLGTQVKVDLENENGDSVVGFIDFVFKWKGIEKPVIIDLKTAGREYEDDSVKKSPQLSLYTYAVSEKYENTRTCGFLVLNKNINKNKHKKCSFCGKDGSKERFKTCNNDINGTRCNASWIETIYPKASSQILISEVSEILTKNVVENFNEIAKAVKSEVFPRNFSSCVKFNGKITCSFYNICHNGTRDGIVEKMNETI